MRRPPPTYPIASVDRALRLLLLVAQRSRLRLTEASEALGVAPSTAHRLATPMRGFPFSTLAFAPLHPPRATIPLLAGPQGEPFWLPKLPPPQPPLPLAAPALPPWRGAPLAVSVRRAVPPRLLLSETSQTLPRALSLPLLAPFRCRRNNALR